MCSIMKCLVPTHLGPDEAERQGYTSGARVRPANALFSSTTRRSAGACWG